MSPLCRLPLDPLDARLALLHLKRGIAATVRRKLVIDNDEMVLTFPDPCQRVDFSDE
jgi:hypothetical protein